MIKSNNYIIKLLKNKLNNKDIDAKNIKLLNKGRFANAYVFRYSDNTNDLTIKDFYHCPWPLRITFGRIMAKMEYNTIKRLEDIPGITPEAYLLGKYTVSFSYIKGEPLKEIQKKGILLPKIFFIKMEKMVRKMHRRNLVHLDLRNLGNVICGDDGNPYIIDFQSSLGTKYIPKKMRKILEDSDISGVYKCWKSTCKEELDPEKENILENFNNIRKIWIFRGYQIHRLLKLIRNN
jgi:RIO-like serine/threonine protein kinase